MPSARSPRRQGMQRAPRQSPPRRPFRAAGSPSARRLAAVCVPAPPPRPRPPPPRRSRCRIAARVRAPDPRGRPGCPRPGRRESAAPPDRIYRESRLLLGRDQQRVMRLAALVNLDLELRVRLLELVEELGKIRFFLARE